MDTLERDYRCPFRWLEDGRGTRTSANTDERRRTNDLVPILFFAFIHRSAWKGNSRKSIYRISNRVRPKDPEGADNLRCPRSAGHNMWPR